MMTVACLVVVTVSGLGCYALIAPRPSPPPAPHTWAEGGLGGVIVGGRWYGLGGWVGWCGGIMRNFRGRRWTPLHCCLPLNGRHCWLDAPARNMNNSVGEMIKWWLFPSGTVCFGNIGNCIWKFITTFTIVHAQTDPGYWACNSSYIIDWGGFGGRDAKSSRNSR